MLSLMFGFAVVLILTGLAAGGVAILRRQTISVLHVLVELGGIGLLIWTTWAALGARERERLKRLNVEAAADSTHHFLRGQLQVATRLIVQVKPKAAAATLTIRVPGDTVYKTDTAYVALDTARARLDTNGVHVQAVVALLPPPPTWSWRLVQDPITYRAALTCEEGAARLTVSGPRWQALQLDSLKQDPAICNPARSWSPISLRPPSLVWAGAIALGTYLIVR